MNYRAVLKTLEGLRCPAPITPENQEVKCNDCPLRVTPGACTIPEFAAAVTEQIKQIQTYAEGLNQRLNTLETSK